MILRRMHDKELRMFILGLVLFHVTETKPIYQRWSILTRQKRHVQCDAVVPSDLFILRCPPNSSSPNTFVPTHIKCYIIFCVFFT